MARRGLTLVEIVFSVALLAIVLLAFGMLATTSVDATASARPNLIAQEAANRLVERMRTEPEIVPAAPPGGSVYEAYFLNYAAAHKPVINGAQYAAPSLDDPTSYAAATTPYNDPFADLVQAFRSGLLRRPTDAPARPLRVRFLDEVQYAAMFQLPIGQDLDFDGVATTAGVNLNYRLYPVFVEIRWREKSGPDRVYQVKTVLGAPAQLDPAR